MRVLGSGANLLVREAGVPGVVIRLDDPAWSQMTVEDNIVTVGAGSPVDPERSRHLEHGASLD